MIEMSKSGYEQFIEAPSRRRLVEQESLILEAAEFLTVLMAKEGVTRAELARRLGRSKAYVTQVLRGSNNLTLRTLAELGTALGYQFRFFAKDFTSGHRVTLPDVSALHVIRNENLLAHWRFGKSSVRPTVQHQPEEENSQIWPLSA